MGDTRKESPLVWEEAIGMGWERQIEVADYRKKVFVLVGDILSFLQGNLSRDEMEEFAEEIIRCCELSGKTFLE